MGWISEWKGRVAANKAADERLHATAFAEMNNGTRREGLWAKALIQAQGDDQKAKGRYLSLLVRAMKDEPRIAGGGKENELEYKTSEIGEPEQVSNGHRKVLSEDDCRRLIEQASGSLKIMVSFSGVRYRIEAVGAVEHADDLDALRNWVTKNIP